MSMPLEAVTATLRANDRLATSLKLTGAEGLFCCCFYSAFNCCDGLVHNCVEVAQQKKECRERGGEITAGSGIEE